MKKLLAIVVLGLLLINPSQADDIRDFQIEGISLGDSLLDYLSESEIKKKKPPNKKIKIVHALKNENLEVYDGVQFWWFDKDKDYKIAGLSGVFGFDNDLKGCRKKQKEIIKDIKDLFPNLTVSESQEKNLYDKTGKSKVYHYRFKFPKGDKINIQCYKFSEDYKKKHKYSYNENLVDHLKVMMVTKIMSDHFINILKETK